MSGPVAPTTRHSGTVGALVAAAWGAAVALQVWTASAWVLWVAACRPVSSSRSVYVAWTVALAVIVLVLAALSAAGHARGAAPDLGRWTGVVRGVSVVSIVVVGVSGIWLTTQVDGTTSSQHPLVVLGAVLLCAVPAVASLACLSAMRSTRSAGDVRASVRRVVLAGFAVYLGAVVLVVGARPWTCAVWQVTS